MNSEAIKAAEEAAERCTDHVNRYLHSLGSFWNFRCNNLDSTNCRSRAPSSVAATVVYIISQLSCEKKLLKGCSFSFPWAPLLSLPNFMYTLDELQILKKPLDFMKIR